MELYSVAAGNRGHRHEFSGIVNQNSLTMKVLFSMLLGWATGFVESLLRLAGFDWKAPRFTTPLCRLQKTLSIAIPRSGGAHPLHLLIYATGMRAEEV